MNCIEKMYKEIEEILLKEKQEFEKLAIPVREIRHGFSSDESFFTEAVEKSSVDYLSQITISDEWVKKPLSPERAKEFIVFIFKKYVCFNGSFTGSEAFLKSVSDCVNSSDDLISTLKKLTNDLIDYKGSETEEIKTFFLNPYNALFSDETGYFAVIKNGKFSDVKRPFGFNPNQMKKIIKETFDEYVNDFKNKFKSDKEYNTFVNALKAHVNKSNAQPLDLEKECTEKLTAVLIANGVSESAITSYLETKGLKLVKQNNYYFRKKAYDEYAEYKKIEFRY